MTASANYVSTLDGLTGYVAKPGAFLMSNEKGEVKTVTVKAGEAGRLPELMLNVQPPNW